jgi:hypothetical protein
MITDIEYYYQQRGVRFNFKIGIGARDRSLFPHPVAASSTTVENEKNAVTREYAAISGNTRMAAGSSTG